MVLCRALKDPGHRSSYGSANLVHMFGKNPSEVKSQRIDMLMMLLTQTSQSDFDRLCRLRENYEKKDLLKFHQQVQIVSETLLSTFMLRNITNQMFLEHFRIFNSYRLVHLSI